MNKDVFMLLVHTAKSLDFVYRKCNDDIKFIGFGYCPPYIHLLRTPKAKQVLTRWFGKGKFNKALGQMEWESEGVKIFYLTEKP